MKRAGFIIAAGALAVLLCDAALGATTRRATDSGVGVPPREDRITTTSRPGNVRYSSPRTTESPRTITRTAPPDPSERMPTASHVIRMRDTHATVGATTRMATDASETTSLFDDRIAPPDRSVRTPRRLADVSAERTSSDNRAAWHPLPAMRTQRRDSDSSVGNVHHGPDYGNVTYSDRHGDWSRSRHAAEYHRRHGRGSSSWASGLTFIYHGGGTFFSISARDDAPYWYNGGWHPWPRGRARGPGCGCVLYYGYWIDVRDVYYVQQLPPPWTTEEFWATSADGWDEAALDQEPPSEYNAAESDFIPKGQVLDVVRDKELVLPTAERRRVEILIAGGIIEQILNEGDSGGAYGYVYDQRAGRLRLTAPTERIAMVETIVRDRPTFDAVTQPDRYGNTAAVVPLVSPIYLEENPDAAGALALENFYAVRRLLEERDALYVQNGKRCWYNAQFGTATVMDQEDGLDQAFGLMEARPFVPRELVQR
jgi:hypothetical protein